MANRNISTTELAAASPAPPATHLPPTTTWRSGQSLTTTDFQYEALPDPETYFRLLKIKSIPHDSIARPKGTRLLNFRAKREPADAAVSHFVECDLTTWPIDSAPKYHAISYTWGDEQSLRRIKVGGKYMQVRPNCEYMLRQVFKHCGSETYIWVDAICISQNDGTEKNHQVYMMGSIYSRADRVLACIGNHGDESQFLFRTLRREEKRLEEIGRARTDHRTSSFEFREFFSLRRTHQVRINLPEPKRLCRAYKATFQRPYFSRVWTVQELWLANAVVVLCGNDSLLAMSLCGFQDLAYCSPLGYFFRKLLRLSPRKYPVLGCILRYPLFPPRRHPILARIPLLDRCVPVTEWKNDCFLIYHVQAIEQGKIKRRDLVQAMRLVGNLQCDDIRDKLYAQITIIDWSGLGIDPIRPDYSIRIFDLALDMLHLASLHDDLHFKTAYDMLAGFLEHPDDSNLQGFRDDFNTVVVERRRYKYSPGSHIQETVKRYREPRPMGFLNGLQIVESCSIWRLRSPPRSPSINTDTNNEAATSDLIHIVEMLPQQYYRRFSFDNGALGVVVPRSVQSWDWIVTDEFSRCNIVLREESNNKFHVVCKAWCSFETEWMLSRAPTYFRAFFDLEDLIVLISPTEPWTKSRYLPIDLTPEQLSNYFSTPICSAPGSSYAEKEREIETSNSI